MRKYRALFGGDRVAAISLSLLAFGVPAFARGSRSNETAAARLTRLHPPLIIGRVIRLSESGFVRRDGIPGDRYLRLGNLIEQGDDIETDGAGSVEIQLFDAQKINVGVFSDVLISASAKNVRLRVRGGFVSTEQKPASSIAFRIKTSTAEARTEGNVFIDDRAKRTYVCAISGSTIVRSRKSALSKLSTLRAGECTRVDRDRLPVALRNAKKFLDRASPFIYLENSPNDDKRF